MALAFRVARNTAAASKWCENIFLKEYSLFLSIFGFRRYTIFRDLYFDNMKPDIPTVGTKEVVLRGGPPSVDGV